MQSKHLESLPISCAKWLTIFWMTHTHLAEVYTYSSLCVDLTQLSFNNVMRLRELWYVNGYNDRLLLRSTIRITLLTYFNMLS